MNWFSQEESLGENEKWVCPKCKEPTETKKQMALWKAPPILVVHLKRFQYYKERWRKSNRLVNFPITSLDPSPWMVEKPKEEIKYELYAIVNHFGRLGSGHYTAYAINPDDGKWRGYDDTRVTLVEDLSQLVSPSAYLMFYKISGIEKLNVFKDGAANAKAISVTNNIGTIGTSESRLADRCSVQ